MTAALLASSAGTGAIYAKGIHAGLRSIVLPSILLKTLIISQNQVCH